MKASESKFLDFIHKSPQIIIPIYQRHYSWTRTECEQLWNDIVTAGRSDNVKAHFIGSIVYIQEGMYTISNLPQVMVIDGQQRLTSIILLLAALADILDKTGEEPVHGFSGPKIRDNYLVFRHEEGEDRYKLLLSDTDRSNLIQALGGPPAEKKSVRIQTNLDFFRARLREMADDLAIVCLGLRKLYIVDVALDQGKDNPQLIFESLNSTGLKLSQSDLLRNYLLMTQDFSEQKRLYDYYWRPIEICFGRRAFSEHFDEFLRNYLILRTRNIPRFDQVYAAFKVYAASPEAGGVEALLRDLKDFAGYYQAMVMEAEKDQGLAKAFLELLSLKATVTLPLLLELYRDYADGLLSRNDFLTIVRLVESYVFRRHVCGIPSNSHNKTFALFGLGLKKDEYLESVKAFFLLLDGYKRFPADDEFKRELRVWQLYKSRANSYCLLRLENHGKKELVTLSDLISKRLTIEHILPQNENLSAAWREALGPDWERIRDAWLHTLGNITLTGYNPEYSDKPFPEKRDMKFGFKESPVTLNKDLGPLERWDEAAILKRAARLADLAAEVWPAPWLPPDDLDAYKPEKPGSREYTIDDHPNLSGGPTRKLFDALRERIMALDPGVVEVFKKKHIPYKKNGTNFVAIIPMSADLNVTINSPFKSLVDHRGLAKDVTNLGHWGQGDAMVKLDSLEAIDYVMSLVRQAFDRLVKAEAGESPSPADVAE